MLQISFVAPRKPFGMFLLEILWSPCHHYQQWSVVGHGAVLHRCMEKLYLRLSEFFPSTVPLSVS